ncbi:MAG TPA: serine protease [Pyrinomonadaceae bacterium]|nr:serine protease [Pyrinomonadaceae bacterium]
MRAYNAESPHPYPQGRSDRSVVWVDTIVSPSATFVRVHFKGFHLAPGDYITVSNPDGSEFWTYTDRGPNGDGDFWAFAVNGDTAVVAIHGGLRGGYGYRIDAIGHGTVDIGRRPTPTPEVVCGTDGREDIACYQSDPGIDAAQRPVARLLFQSGPSLYVCTGELVRGSNNSTMITNSHCFSTQTEVNTVQASFNYQRTTCGGSTNATVTDYAGGTLLKTNSERRKGNKGGLDYTLLTLQGNPEATWGELIATTKPVSVGDLIWFIQHPGGNQKKIGYWEDAAHTVRCKVNTINATYGQSAAGSQTGYGCDSEGGSSGSAITDPATGHIIALHHYGGVSSSPCLNSGTAMSKICADAGSLLQCASN